MFNTENMFPTIKVSQKMSTDETLAQKTRFDLPGFTLPCGWFPKLNNVGFMTPGLFVSINLLTNPLSTLCGNKCALGPCFQVELTRNMFLVAMWSEKILFGDTFKGTKMIPQSNLSLPRNCDDENNEQGYRDVWLGKESMFAFQPRRFGPKKANSSDLR